jgi:uroporphyrinogen decarboxylase
MEVTRDIYYIPDKLAALMCLGTPEEVEAYCKKVIDVVGDGGGFILSTGCTCPADCKIENLQAMVDTAKSYWPH